MTTSQDKTFVLDNDHCLYNCDEISHFSPEMLNAEYWQLRNAITGSAQGRGTTWFIGVKHRNKPTQHWVLRHYYRGGLIGKVINDTYLFTGMKNTRAAKEYALLQHMSSLSLPAPKAVAYRVTRYGIFYKADLLSSRITQATDLVDILSKGSITDALWQNIGATIKRFHDQGIYHHDLNSHNILINDENEVFLIDFDRGEVRTDNASDVRWKQDNMARLERSFLKEQKKLSQFHFTNENWLNLLTGYNK
ncbi:3-deoxy-D-manno-octulosonic acid kinase [Colwellia sp. D2M02]|uniref:3-deoxy-D-manno-octulosonic acid kinase n=1 Tax=Colwellia asteriadis TaxID=517723 RepID=A0ABN1L441_9GAMM|nr:3-deoxy-D-manno-octulosonic acid kinase [Colwellia sp. D2M02]MBU2894620.1 3-deoxy-D-manno-octulosonic acid kinase [Colwellia sp. D2M02]